jgi:hypothetical protein
VVLNDNNPKHPLTANIYPESSRKKLNRLLKKLKMISIYTTFKNKQTITPAKIPQNPSQ